MKVTLFIAACSTDKKNYNLFNAHGEKFMVTITPDKLTVYQDCLTPVKKTFNISEFLTNSGTENPNLAQSFIDARNQITDLFLPNDTHLSTNGFIFMRKPLTSLFK